VVCVVSDCAARLLQRVWRHLFWEPAAKDYVAIAAGTLDAPTGLKTALQIHVESAGDYYAVDERIPRRSP
jgi:hypothetical protein